MANTIVEAENKSWDFITQSKIDCLQREMPFFSILSEERSRHSSRIGLRSKPPQALPADKRRSVKTGSSTTSARQPITKIKKPSHTARAVGPKIHNPGSNYIRPLFGDTGASDQSGSAKFETRLCPQFSSFGPQNSQLILGMRSRKESLSQQIQSKTLDTKEQTLADTQSIERIVRNEQLEEFVEFVSSSEDDSSDEQPKLKQKKKRLSSFALALQNVPPKNNTARSSLKQRLPSVRVPRKVEKTIKLTTGTWESLGGRSPLSTNHAASLQALDSPQKERKLPVKSVLKSTIKLQMHGSLNLSDSLREEGKKKRVIFCEKDEIQEVPSFDESRSFKSIGIKSAFSLQPSKIIFGEIHPVSSKNKKIKSQDDYYFP